MGYYPVIIRKMNAEQLRLQGNEAFQRGENAQAIIHYSQAIMLEGRNAILFSNRCVAFLANGQLIDALADADKAISLNPSWFRGYQRKAQVLQAQTHFAEAIVACKRAIELEQTITLKSFLDTLQKGQEQHPAIGISLGTSYSSVAVLCDGKPIVLADETGQHLIPSVLAFSSQSDTFHPLVGSESVNWNG